MGSQLESVTMTMMPSWKPKLQSPNMSRRSPEEFHFAIKLNPLRRWGEADTIVARTQAAVTKYVEAISGKEFHFAIKLNPLYRWGEADTIVARPTLDGTKRTGVCMQKRHFLLDLARICKVDGAWSGSGSNAKLHKFVFADLQTRKLAAHSQIPTSS